MNKSYIELPLEDLKKYKLGASYYVRINFPHTVHYKGRQYWETGKNGVNFKTRLPVAEYECDGKRVWCDANMELYED